MSLYSIFGMYRRCHHRHIVLPKPSSIRLSVSTEHRLVTDMRIHLAVYSVHRTGAWRSRLRMSKRQRYGCTTAENSVMNGRDRSVITKEVIYSMLEAV